MIKAGHASQSDPLDRFYAKNLTLRIFEKGKVGTVRKFSDAIWFSKEDKWILKSASGKEFYFYSNEMKLVSVN